MVRNSDKGAQVAKAYPNARLVYGDLDSYDLIRDEAAKADIVCHFANCDHEESATAIIDGLSKRADGGKPGYLIHTSGTGILEIDDRLRGTYGTRDEKVYDDWDGVGAVTSLPDQAFHRAVDKIVLAASKRGGDGAAPIRTAIVCPPTIYGPGRGPGNQTSEQIPRLVELTLRRRRGFRVGKGESVWTQVHVQDLSRLYLALVEAAAAGDGSATWDDEGYYFAESGEFAWGDMAAAVAAECRKQGFIDSDEVDGLSKDQVDQIVPYGSARWGMNSRGKAIRAGKLLGWKPSGKSPKEEMPALVQQQARKLGLIKGHAVQAAGLE